MEPLDGEALAAREGVDKVAFTRSTAAGANVAQAAVANINKISGTGRQIAAGGIADADLAAADGLVAGLRGHRPDPAWPHRG